MKKRKREREKLHSQYFSQQILGVMLLLVVISGEKK